MYGECHGHIFMNGKNYQQAVALHKNGVQEADIREKLLIYQQHGVTFFRDGGDALGVSETAKLLAPEYGIDYRTPIFAIHKNGHYGSIVGCGFDTMKEYHDLVLQVRRKKGDFIKVMFSGIMDFGTDGGVTGTPLERTEIREMIHIAHEEGFVVMAHVNGARAVQDALESGVDSVEHGNFMDAECLQVLTAVSAVWVPTAVTIHNLYGCGRFDDSVIDRLQKLQCENIQKAYGMGAVIALGSDAGAYMVPHGQGIEDEYHLFQRILPDDSELDKRLQTAEAQIRNRFQSD